MVKSVARARKWPVLAEERLDDSPGLAPHWKVVSGLPVTPVTVQRRPGRVQVTIIRNITVLPEE